MTDEPIDSPGAISAMRRRHLKLAFDLQALASHAVRELQEKAAQGRLDLTVDDAKKLMDAGLKLERQAQPAQRRPLCPPAKRTRKGNPR